MVMNRIHLHGSAVFLGLPERKLGVEHLDGGAESGLELHGRLVSENLVLTGCDGIQYRGDQISRVQLGVGGRRSHRRRPASRPAAG